MRAGWVVLVMMLATAGKAQVMMPGRAVTGPNAPASFQNTRMFPNNANPKWTVSHYTGLSMGYQFFKGGSATVISAPLAWQLSRQLTHHVYAFGGVTVAPAYVNINSAIRSADVFKGNNSFMRTGGQMGIYSKAELGLFYTNSEHTFSISGSIGVEKSSYPSFYNGNSFSKPLPVAVPNR